MFLSLLAYIQKACNQQVDKYPNFQFDLLKLSTIHPVQNNKVGLPDTFQCMVMP